jgi:hypothetical protein
MVSLTFMIIFLIVIIAIDITQKRRNDLNLHK